MTFNLPIFRSRSTDIANNRSNISNIFEEFFNDFNRLSSPLLSEGMRASLLPRINISETDNKYFIEAELPGVKQNDVELKLDNNILIIKGKTEETTENKERNYFMRERYYGSFQRSLTLPNNTNEDDINATFKDGILNIEISKKQESSTKRIEVKAK
ncbi:Hsp20/alpha crystallin family protein (plasmid) [Candidatus Trichorickettsia mobilis]|jgi:HSP20 family protein|uniref:Hsp20/alpha crystallin family protein n=1 Tax=Candidatus Trichorickettsia mobilis TaxID=1346319 RepID=UPI002B25FE0E|nr:Hsp20/alpha crystallin family protein [Candidatus Trichorickettsia mobilis]WPY01857.1 Hsp20/alpha crystallin family protein [Candidatus Trichorickettsia mobilis]